MKIPIIYKAEQKKTGTKRYFFDNKGRYSNGDYVRLPEGIHRIIGVNVKGFNFKAR